MQLLAIKKTGYRQTKRNKDRQPKTNKQTNHTHTQSKQRQEEAADRKHTKSESEIFTTAFKLIFIASS